MHTLALLAALLCSNPALALEVGDPSPDLTVDGAKITGQVTLVNFWATWCAPCRKEMPLLNALHQRIADVGAQVVAVNIDSRSKIAEATVRQLKFTAPVIYDPSTKLADQFQPPAMPTSYLVDQNGMITKVIVGGLDEQALSDLEAEIRQLSAGQK